MKVTLVLSTALFLALLLTSGALAAQHQPGGQMQMGSQPAPQQPAAPHQPGMGPGMMGPGGMGMMCPMMSMMPMMGQMMGGQADPSGMAMMGMMGAGQMDPKAMGRMLQFRGELLKAMGDVMLKHGKAMGEGK